MAKQDSPPTDTDQDPPRASSGQERLEGAPFPPGELDPDLIKLRRPRPKIGMVTAAGVVLLCGLFWLRLGPDRAFGASPAEPRPVALGDVLDGKVATEQLVELSAEPLMGHAVRIASRKGNAGVRAAPARGTGDRLWLLLPGDGLSPPSEQPMYRGRLRPLHDLPVAEDLRRFLAHNPRPVFATLTAVRAAAQRGELETVTGDLVKLSDHDKVSIDVLDLGASVLQAPVSERFPDAAAWQTALRAAGLPVHLLPAPQSTDAIPRFALGMAAAEASKLLERAGLWTVRAEPVLRTQRGTWAELRASPPSELTLGGATVPDAHVDLVGFFVARDLPAQAYALITEESPADYWYVRPISLALIALGLFFTWILVQAVRRDLLPVKAA
ncbi:MAG: hypothetical protein R3B48_14750 [Kofleriaceae bacterium]